uniref:Protein kinase domain-containing protein n=1 Tax=Chenopodium quinoa TaxID=63459 RepID=A0A803L0D8_CHEQI
MIVVEFDSLSNPEWDPSYEHVGININSIESSVTKRWNATQHSGVPADVSIIYNASTENLSVHWSYSNEPKNFLSYPIDLMQVIPEWVSIGFSAATGQFAERHILESWEFYSSLNITEDEALRKDNNDDLQIKVKFNKLGLILVSLGVFLFILGGIIVLFFLCRKRKMPRQERAEDTSFNEEIERGAGPRRFSYIELESATQNFSSEQKLGEGGFGGVYKGYLMDLDMPIAVKKFSRGSRQGKKEYSTEFLGFLGFADSGDEGARLHLTSVVRDGDCHVISCCGEHSYSLNVWRDRFDRFIDHRGDGSRYDGGVSGDETQGGEEVESVAKQPSQSPVDPNALGYATYSYDTVPCPIDPKGLGNATDSCDIQASSVDICALGYARTFGYMAPEYLSTGKASKESDVYSFGVVALEIATGRRATNLIEAGTHQGKGLVNWVWDLYGNGELHLATDQKLNHMECDTKQIECLMLLGLWCAYPDYNHRPSIKQAIQVLNFETIMPSLPPKMPVPIYQVPMMPSDSSSSGPSMLNTSVETGR